MRIESLRYKNLNTTESSPYKTKLSLGINRNTRESMIVNFDDLELNSIGLNANNQEMIYRKLPIQKKSYSMKCNSKRFSSNQQHQA